MTYSEKLMIGKYIRMIYLTGVVFVYSTSVALAMPNNNTLPLDGKFIGNTNGSITYNEKRSIMDVVQNAGNAVIKWDNFSIGGNATVNFSQKDGGKFNVLNYVNSGNMSEIYGTINANQGNVFLVNPAGVTIGKSAQINVGSLYVSNYNLKDKELGNFNGQNIDNLKIPNTPSAGDLMNLGYINAAEGKVTFEGNRIVLDVDRIRDASGSELYKSQEKGAQLTVRTDDINRLTLGYNAYDTENKYMGKNDTTKIAIVNDTEYTKEQGYMWIDNVQQLQAISSNSSGKYALHRSIDAVETVMWNENKGFEPVKNFSGHLDGLGYSIFDITINRENEKDVGIFSSANDSVIKNINLVGGKVEGSENVGSIVGKMSNSVVSDIITSVSINGKKNIGGVVGNAVNNNMLMNLVNIGGIRGAENVGGLAGYIEDGNLSGKTYNLGKINGGINVGGLVGVAERANIGDESQQIYNKMDVTGAYNVGGIVGAMQDSILINALNYNSVVATNVTEEEYKYYGVKGAAADDSASSEKIGEEKKSVVGKNKYDGAAGDNSLQPSDTAVANVGGIVGKSNNSELIYVTNEGDVKSSVKKEEISDKDYYIGGNVGGIVGRAENTCIENAINKENKIYGAHNVGGIVGYIGVGNSGKSCISNSVNNGGEVYGTGARNSKGERLTEWVRPSNLGKENNYIGNIGGIAGYVYANGGEMSIKNTGNRGNVSSTGYSDFYIYGDSASGYRGVSNVGGIVGKMDQGNTYGNNEQEIANGVEKKLEAIRNKEDSAIIEGSYNVGKILGTVNVGGIVGMMYNGSIADSYNSGNIMSLNNVKDAGNAIWINMGGIVGGTTENVLARSILYNVYNDGVIGDKNFVYGGIHVGGVAGRFSGYMGNSYNTGAVYNTTHATGGVTGAIWKANIKNVFNTGNITVLNKNYAGGYWADGVGGIAGVKVADTSDMIENAYNIGIIRSFIGYDGDSVQNRINAVGGIVGAVNAGSLTVKNAYTRGEIYAGKYNANTKVYEKDDNAAIGAVYGQRDAGSQINTNAVYYIKPHSDSAFIILSGSENAIGNTFKKGNLQGTTGKAIEYDKANEYAQYQQDVSEPNNNFSFLNRNDPNSAEYNSSNPWRMYETSAYNTGTTPILDVFRPEAIKYFGTVGQKDIGDYAKRRQDIDYIQYGTAYNPFLTIIYANDKKDTVHIDFKDLNNSYKGGFAVYNSGLTVNNFGTNANVMYNGVMYCDGDLLIDGGEQSADIKLGAGSEIYGSSVTLNTKDNIYIYGDVKATGNSTFNSVVDNNVHQVKINPDTRGDVSMQGKNIEVYGHVSSAKKDEDIIINGVRGGRNNIITDWKQVNVETPSVSVPELGTLYAYSTGNDHGNGNITITAVRDVAASGNVNIGLGSVGRGYLEAYDGLTVQGNDIYIDSDLRLGGDITLDAVTSVLDISNIGKVDNRDMNGNKIDTVDRLHNFLKNFSKTSGGQHSMVFKNSNGVNTDAIIAADMWNGEDNTFDLDKYNSGDEKFQNLTYNLNVKKDGKVLEDTEVKNLTHIWIENGTQLAAIQKYVGESGNEILEKNFALKNNIDMYDVNGYQSVDGFKGDFDGRGNSIIGLTADGGVFKTIDEIGSVRNFSIYSSNITGKTEGDVVGVVAGINQGNINNIVAFGNNVTTAGGIAGGIAGKNNGKINNVNVSNIIQGDAGGAIIGGVVGENDGYIDKVSSSSSIVSLNYESKAMGGVAGINNRELYNSISTKGVISGLYGGSSVDDINEYGSSKNVGGIVGINDGIIDASYNDSYVNGWETVGGVIGENTANGRVCDIVNGSVLYGGGNIGGIVGINKGEVNDGRNNGAVEADANHVINGNEKASGTNVGGLVGINYGSMSNLINDNSAAIIGKANVGGIIGSNSGILTSSHNLMNAGKILGVEYVGGIVGVNEDKGVIVKVENTNNYMLSYNDLYNGKGEYFGGIIGHNKGVVGDVKNNATIDVIGDVQYIGGIIGRNDGKIASAGKYEYTDVDGYLINNGGVEAKNGKYVGGLIGFNARDIEKTNLINSITGNVTGLEYVGGLIGDNEASVSGGRDDASNMYQYKVYNNGTVTGDDFVGGIAGNNKQNALIDAAYNTGVITGDNFVGGIAGENEGRINQVFNTVYESSGLSGEIKAKEECVGGIVGNNSGHVENAYNTSKVSGKSSIGSIVGSNSGQINNVYSTVREKSAGENTGTFANSYSFSQADKGVEGVTVLSADEMLEKDSYEFTSVENTWKFYDGFTTPLLRVFLTKASYQNFNGAVDGSKFEGADGNAAFTYTLINGGSKLLQSGVAKDGYYYLYSMQLTGSMFDGQFYPNWLGYDLDIKYKEDSIMPYNPKFKQWDDKYSWGKRHNERERKAEIRFVDGAMEV